MDQLMDQHLLLASQSVDEFLAHTEPLAAASEPAPAPAKQGWQANVAGTDLGIFVSGQHAGLTSAAPPLPQWSVLDYARALQTPTAAASLTFAPAATAASLPAPFVDGTGPVPADPQAGVRALDLAREQEEQKPDGRRSRVNDGDERSSCLRSAECSKPRGHRGFCDKRRPLAAQEEEEPVPRPSRAPLSAPLSSGEIDRKLWTGAAAAGWSVMSSSGRSNYTYIAPDGRAKFSSANKAGEHAGETAGDARARGRDSRGRWKMCDGSVNRS